MQFYFPDIFSFIKIKCFAFMSFVITWNVLRHLQKHGWRWRCYCKLSKSDRKKINTIWFHLFVESKNCWIGLDHFLSQEQEKMIHTICQIFFLYFILSYFWGLWEQLIFFKFLLLFNYSCMPFLPIPAPHPSWTHLPPPPPPSPLIWSMCPL